MTSVYDVSIQFVRGKNRGKREDLNKIREGAVDNSAIPISKNSNAVKVLLTYCTCLQWGEKKNYLRREGRMTFV